MLRSQLIGPVALATLLIVACDSDELESIPLRSSSTDVVDRARRGDECAPGNAPNVDDAPDALCAEKLDAVVPDLIDGEDLAAQGETVTTDGSKPQSLRFLSAPGTDRPSCQGKTGPGITTCGPNKDENCCRSLDVPGGKAGAIKVDTFDLGVYEVTVGRFESFVEATGGNLRGAAENHAAEAVAADESGDVSAVGMAAANLGNVAAAEQRVTLGL